jgi:hypothetical protein
MNEIHKICFLSSASVLIQFIYEDLDFQSPFFVTYLATSLLALHLPGWYLNDYVTKYLEARNRSTGGYEDLNALVNSASTFQNVTPLRRTTYGYFMTEHWDIIKVAMVISPLWFGANCLYNYSLLMTTVSSSTIIRYLFYVKTQHALTFFS